MFNKSHKSRMMRSAEHQIFLIIFLNIKEIGRIAWINGKN